LAQNLAENSGVDVVEAADAGHFITWEGLMFWSRCVYSAFVLLAVSLLSSGCATMFSRSYDDLTIESNPPGAEVFIGAEKIGTTPFTKRFDRVAFDSPEITLRKEGYKPKTVTLERTVATPALGNLVFILTTMGVTSWGIDAASGNMIQYAPDSYLIDLQRLDSGGSASWHKNHVTLAFVLTNQMNLMRDISKGGGEYLKAYYQLNIAPISTASYPTFVDRVRKESRSVLLCENGLELYHALIEISRKTIMEPVTMIRPFGKMPLLSLAFQPGTQ
jgi:hypothetical protein